ncbi:hypothetical protein [Bradyrhizobium sp. 170]|uniref:hypothetical protein n=1 Tax=Bradyrhizobium sp. 170 TaxID=2782641 RepID=UPI001FFE46F5|nr:hypothetical protein [Bradyrhizobium sp. 170]UPK04547.1 hypothetical protein IVB05_02005 [Bradyrhizobium sp. 170]
MAQESTAENSPQHNGNKIVQPAGKIVVSSVVTHESLIDAIKKRNPIIASRTEAER